MELPNRPMHEAEFARRLSHLSGKHRRELVALLGNPPDINRVPASFWERVEREQREELLFGLLLLFTASAEHHGLGISDAEQLANGWAPGQATSVASGYVANSRAALQDAANGWQASIDARVEDAGFEAGTELTLPRAEIEDGALDIFGPGRDAVIANNEMTRAVTTGGEQAVGAQGLLSPEDEWQTNPGLSATGPCPVCEPLDGTPRSYWERFFPFGPPEPHVGCVCEIVYAAMLVPAEVGA